MQHEHSLSSGTEYLAVVKDVGLAVGCQLIWCKELKGPHVFYMYYNNRKTVLHSGLSSFKEKA